MTEEKKPLEIMDWMKTRVTVSRGFVFGVGILGYVIGFILAY